MPSSAGSIRSKRRGLFIGVIAVVLLAALFVIGSPLVDRASAATIPMVFPLEFRVTVHHDYLAPRVGHLHQGTDLMAPKMTKELACVSGRVTLRVGSYNGVPEYSLWLAGDDGHGYFYIHINNDTPGTDDGQGGLQYAFAPGLVSGAHVEQGQHIAYVGDSGNAEGTGSHLHFEIHETTSMSSPSMDPYDSLVNAPLADGTAPPPPPSTPNGTRYQQNNSNITYAGKWLTFTTSGASGGSYAYADSAASASIGFTGTQLDLIATKGYTQGKVKVSVDGGTPVLVDLYSSTTLRQQRVWSTGTLAQGTHKVVVSWSGQPHTTGGPTRVNIDAVDVQGSLIAPPPSTASITRYQQNNSNILYSGKWLTFITSGASGGSYAYADSAASASIWFTGTQLDLIATKGYTQGKVRVSVDGGTAVLVDLYNATTLRQQKVWSTGTLAQGTHKVTLSWSGQPHTTGGPTRVNIDAVDVTGSLVQAGP
jgi:hypothetical protein